MIGTSIGNYVVRDKIGEGGMGAVYVAEHNRLGKRVAVKVLLPQLGRNADLVARFFNEAKAATEIRNEHIVDVLDFGELADGSSYLVMEWLDGVSLASLLEREGRLSLARTAKIARGVAKALTAAHAHGIVHRDLKPDNIYLVTRDGDPDFVKVLDFGIAKLNASDAGDVRTQAGALMGTPLYMSPEQCNGTPVDQRTDVYAMGIILYQMLTGAPPFTTTKLTELLVAHLTTLPPPLRDREPTIPLDVEQAVLMALEKDPARRFHSIDALARALDGASSATHAVAATPLPTPAPATPTAAELFVRVGVRGKRPLVTLGLVLAAIVALSVVLVVRRAPSPAATTPPASAGVVTTEPVVPAPSKDVSHWKLASTDCPPGTMPPRVTSTRVGNKVYNHAPGVPSNVAITEPDGRFRITNHGGTCVGHGDERTVTETCTNALHMSCHATYERAD